MELTRACKDALSAYSDPADGAHVIADENTTARVQMDPDTRSMRVAIRGSDDVLDWCDNLRRWRHATGFGGLHAGFWRHSQRIATYLGPRLPAVRKIHLSGHSLGGAVATVVGCVVARQFPGVAVEVVTFGSPRVGDAAFRDACIEQRNLHITRVHNDRDVVTWFPYFGYHHVGQDVRVSTEDTPWYHFRVLHGIAKYAESLPRAIGEVLR